MGQVKARVSFFVLVQKIICGESEKTGDFPNGLNEVEVFIALNKGDGITSGSTGKTLKKIFVITDF